MRTGPALAQAAPPPAGTWVASGRLPVWCEAPEVESTRRPCACIIVRACVRAWAVLRRCIHSVTFHVATPADMDAILDMVQELAEFEKAPDVRAVCSVRPSACSFSCRFRCAADLPRCDGVCVMRAGG